MTRTALAWFFWVWGLSSGLGGVETMGPYLTPELCEMARYEFHQTFRRAYSSRCEKRDEANPGDPPVSRFGR